MKSLKKLYSSSILIAPLLFFFLSSHAQTNISLQGSLSYTDGVTDIWGYVDGSGNEYALLGTTAGLSVVDISTPSSPTEVVFIPGPASSGWWDVKVWDDYAYVINEASTGGGLMIVDLSVLPGGIPTTTFSNLGIGYTDSHNIFIDENGIGYLFGASSSSLGSGTIICDIAANPTNPTYLGIYTTNYVHDGFVRNDMMWTGEIYEGELAVVDVSNKAVPTRLSAVGTPNAFTHNCWLSDDGQTAFTTDERNGSYVTAYDVSDIYDIKELDRYQAFPGTNVVPHNTFVKDDFLVTSYYTAGVKITDATYPYNLIETGFYDTSPATTGGGYNGCWGTYPFFGSGTLLASDRQNGLFVFTMNCVQAAYLEGNVTDINTGNPIPSASVTVTYSNGNPATFGNGYFTKSDLVGFYATGASQSGAYTVTVDAPCYETLIVTGVNLTSGLITNLAAQMTPITSVSVNLAATNISTTTTDLSWDIAPNAVSYNVYYRPVGSSTWVILPSSTNSISLTSLTPGTDYEFQIESICGNGVSVGTSTNANFTTLALCVVPSNLTSSNISSTGATLNWMAVPNASTYTISYRPVGSSTWQTITVASNSAILTGLSPSTAYEFLVETNCGAGSEPNSGNSNTATFTTLQACAAPTNLAANVSSDTTVDISWTGIVGGTSYTLFYREVGTSAWSSIIVSSSPYTLTDLTPNTDYEFYVQGDCGSSTGNPSSTTPFSTLQSCLAPTGISIVTITSTSATISWNGVGNGVNYILSYRPIGTSTWQSMTITSSLTVITGLMEDTAYEFTVQTNCNANSVSSSTPSSTNSFTTPLFCTTPSNMAANNVTDTQVDISWTGVANGVSYNLYYQEVGTSTWNSVVVTSGTSYTLTGLIAGTNYIFYVESDCGSGITGLPSTTTPFSTLQACLAPTGITTDNLTSSSVFITWNGVSNGIDYLVSYRPLGTSTWQTITVTGTSTTITGLLEDTTYEYAIQTNCGANSISTSTPSTSDDFTTPLFCTTPSNMSVSNVSDTQVDISWTGVANGVSYNLYYQEVGASTWNSITVASGTSYTLTGLIAGTDYNFYVESDCGGGITGLPSTSTPFTTLQACLAPTGLAVDNLTDVSVTLNWQAIPNGLTYLVSFRAIGAATWITNTTNTNSILITGLSPATDYEFMVQTNCGANSVANSSDSGTTPFSTLVLCTNPSNINVANTTDTAVDISWTGVTNGVSYTIYFRPVGSVTWQSTIATTSPFTLMGLSPDTEYEYYIESVCSNNTSPPSSTDSFNTNITCVSPSNLSSNNIGLNSATLSWLGDNSSTNYSLQIRVVGSNTWGILGSVQASTYTINDLEPCTTYEVQLFSDCGLNNVSQIINTTFTTASPSAAWTSTLTTICNGAIDLSDYVSGTSGGVWSGGTYISANGIFDPTGLQTGDYPVTYTVGTTNCQDSQTYNVLIEECTAIVSVKLLLEGPYDPATGKMTTILNTLNLIPDSQPYNTAPWNYSGTESFTSIDSKVVDWVLVELRGANKTTIVAQQAALLLEDGTLTDVNGIAGLRFKNLNYNDAYFLVVRHRNHLDVMSNGAISLGTNDVYDFTTATSQALGVNQLKAVASGIFALHAGDCSGDGTFTVDDYNLYRAQASLISQYLAADINLDKTVTVKDFNIYQPNSSLIGASFIRY